jgi:NAD(P)-dependent dehydrogenase (short-subunit alcohol dehydrogenase family)
VLSRADRLDAVLHNAGALVAHRNITADGHELTFQTNHLAPFLLQRVLGPLVERTPDSRIIVTSSEANRRGRVDLDDLDRQNGRYHAFSAYAASKLENILFVRELSRRLTGTGTISVAVHPGNVATAFGSGSFFPGFFYRIPIKQFYLIAAEEGAGPLLMLATMPDPGPADGLYYDRFAPRGKTAGQAEDADLARGLWERSEAMVGAWL